MRVPACVLLGLVLGCSTAPEAGPDGGGPLPEPPGAPDAAAGGGPVEGCRLADAPPVEAVFTGGGPEPDLAIEDRLVALIDGALPNARLRAAFAYLDQQRVADALIAAHQRGVDVALVLDERNQVLDGDRWTWNGAVASLRAALGPERVVACGGGDRPPDEAGGCIGPVKQHNAFLLVSETCDGAVSIVAQTSAYPIKPQLFVRNNLVVVRGDDALFAAYDDYWRDLARMRRDDSYYRIVDGERGTRAFFYPRASGGEADRHPASDTIYVLLDENVDCAGKTRVRLAMAYWTSTRDYLVDALARLAARGCDVAVVANPAATDAAVAADLEAAFGAGQLAMVPGVHHKYLLIDGRYGGVDTSLVWTGTQDFTATALRANDEAILRLEGEEVHGRFLADWTAMFAAAPAD